MGDHLIITICDDGKYTKNRKGKCLPYAFTEHGVTMLASVFKSPKARKMNIAIVRTL
jgi:hypothetical protein